MCRRNCWQPCCCGTGRARPTATMPPQSIVITATRHAMPLVDAPAAMSVVTGEQIAERGADNVFEALRGETGVSMQGRTIGGRTAMSLRGMEFRHTLYLVDGKRIGGTDGVVGHSDFQYDWVATEDIERIEVVRGPMSVLYGSEALGGVINVITRRPGPVWAFGMLAEGRWGDNSLGGDGNRAAVRASGPVTENLSVAVSLADTWRQALALKEDPRLTEIEGRHKHDGAIQVWGAPAAGHEIEIEYRTGQEDRWANARERSGARRIYESLTGIDRSHGSLGWRADWSGPWQAQSLLRAYESRVDVSNERNNGVAGLRPNNFADRIVEGQLSARAAARTAAHWRLRGSRRAPLQHRPAGRRRPGESRRAVCAGRVRTDPGAGADGGLAPRPTRSLRRRVEPARLRRVARGAGLDREGRHRPRLQGAVVEADLAGLSRGRRPQHLLRQRLAAARDERCRRTRRRLGHAGRRCAGDGVREPGREPDRAATVAAGRHAGRIPVREHRPFALPGRRDGARPAPAGRIRASTRPTPTSMRATAMATGWRSGRAIRSACAWVGARVPGAPASMRNTAQGRCWRRRHRVSRRSLRPP